MKPFLQLETYEAYVFRLATLINDQIINISLYANIVTITVSC